MSRLPITQPRYERTEGDGSFDSSFTESARSLLASFDAYMAAQGGASAADATSPGETRTKQPPETVLE